MESAAPAAVLTEHCSVDCLQEVIGYVLQDNGPADKSASSWLLDDSVLTAWSGHDKLLAVAKGHRLWMGGAGGAQQPVQVALPLHESYSALCWVAFARSGPASTSGGGGGGGDHLLLTGSNKGRLRVYSHNGFFVQSQLLHHGPVVSIRPRVAPAGCDDISEDVCVAFTDAAVQLDALELEGVLRRHQLQCKAGSRARAMVEAAGFESIEVSKWDLRRAAAGPVSDAIITGRLQPSLYESLTGTGAASKHNVCILTAGENPSVGVFGGPESEGSVLAAASQLASAAVAASATAVAAVGSAVFSLITPWGAKSLSATLGGSGGGGGGAGGGGGRGSAGGGEGPGPGPREDDDEVPSGIGAQRRYCFGDPPRRVRSLCQSPGGGLVVSADASGRVFLLDIQSGVTVVRVWKGYRGAEALWVSSGAGRPGAPGGHSHRLYVAVFLRARDGLLEVWEPRRGSRVGALRCGANCRVFSSCAQFGVRGQKITETELYVLDGTSGKMKKLGWTARAPGKSIKS